MESSYALVRGLPRTYLHNPNYPEGSQGKQTGAESSRGATLMKVQPWNTGDTELFSRK